MEKILKVKISDAENGFLLKHILKKKMGLTERQISQAKFREKGICVNGIQKRVNERVKIWDEVSVKIEAEETDSHHLVPASGTIQVLYEDADLIIVNKPAGVVVHPSPGHYSDSLANWLVYYYKNKGESVKVRAVGRLDMDTSGVLVFAKNQIGAARLAEQREKGELKKEYLAVVQGIPREKCGIIDQPIAACGSGHLKMQVSKKGKQAWTEYRILAAGKEKSLLAVRIHTGRTHQIRVHMSWLGFPLLGDEVYGGKRNEIRRTALHAWRIELYQPFTGKQICIEVPMPKDMEFLLGDDFQCL